MKAQVNRIYQAIDGKQFDNRKDCVAYERKIEVVENIKTSLATVFENSEDVYESLVDGLSRMTIADRKTVLNGLINLTIEKKKPVRKAKETVEAVEATETVAV